MTYPIPRAVLLQRLNARLQGGKRPYAIRNADGSDGKPAELRIYTQIGVWGISEEEFAAELAEVTADEIVVSISSPGGDVFSGVAIYNALRQHPARVTTRVDGVAASIASVVVQAGDHRAMTSHSQMMVHEAWGFAVGPAEDLRELADLLERQNDVIAGIYADRGSKSRSHYLRMMQAETWMTDREAISQGLADEILEPGKSRPNNDLTDEQMAVLSAAQHELWRAEMQEAARRISLEEIRESFSESLEWDPRDALAYVEVEEALVRAATRRTTAELVAAVSADLGIKPPQVCWFRQAQTGETAAFESKPIDGRADNQRRTIWLKSSLTGSDLKRIVAHEIAHIAGRDELDAQIYEKGWMT